MRKKRGNRHLKIKKIIIHEDYCPRNPRNLLNDAEIKKSSLSTKELYEYRVSQTPPGYDGYLVNLLVQEEGLIILRAAVNAKQAKFRSRCICKFTINKTQLANFRKTINARGVTDKKKSYSQEAKILQTELKKIRKQAKIKDRAEKLKTNAKDRMGKIPSSETGVQVQGNDKYGEPTCSHQRNEEPMEPTEAIPSTESVTMESSDTEIIDISSEQSIESACDEAFEEGEEKEIQLSDSDTGDEVNESNEGSDNSCLICDKTGHNSFYCQMICKYCSAPHHSIKNCPNLSNQQIALYTLIESTMKQLRTYNVNHNFSSPMNERTASVAKKKIKFNRNNAKSDDEETSDSESKEEDKSSEETPDAAKKSKRIRHSETVVQKPPTVPFHIKASRLIYNPLLFPFGSPINWKN